MPAVFVGHGNPMNALQTNTYTEAWAGLGAGIPKPSGILSISAHWYINDTAVTSMAVPRTIHDFGGFPRALFDFDYPAPGDPALAERIRGLLDPLPVRRDTEWGLDHGTWAVLCHMYPQADVPVVQLSIDASQSGSFHFAIGQRLAALREEGILLFGSGNLVHNLRMYAWDGAHVEPYDWARRFEERARGLITASDYGPLVDYSSLGPDARLSIPTPDHYLPLLYVLGARDPDEPVSFPVEGIDGGSISMLAVRVG